MKTTINTLSSNHSTQPSQTSRLSQVGVTLAMSAILLCGLAALSTNSAAQAQIMTREAAVERGWAQIPGELIRPDCVHEIPNGARVEVENGKITGDVTMKGTIIAHYDACSEAAVSTRSQESAQVSAQKLHDPGTGNGWVEGDEWKASLSSTDNIDYLGGIWTVPTYPELDGAVLYIFNGIEPTNRAWLLQPVLQFGLTPAGGGNYWGIASWIVNDTGYAFHSPLVTVYPGDVISGYTWLTSTSGSTNYWEVVAQDTNSGFYSWIAVSNSVQHWTLAFRGVLEAYNVTSCSQFPSNKRIFFSDSEVAHGFPNYDVIAYPDWVGAIYGYGGPTCNFAVVAASSTLDY